MEKFKKIKNCLLAFIIPCVLCLAILYGRGILQDVENIFVTDLKVQHISFFSYLKNVLIGQASMYYSFYAGMGSSMIATLIFYCISPINLLLIIVDDIRYAILLIYILKVSLSGLTMFILLKNKHNGNVNFMTILFSTCYALSAFAISYFFCMFWFDSLYLAPLVTLGIDKIFKEEKISLLYILSLALAIICNIQMGFGLCVYSVVYYIYSFNINYSIKKDLKKFKQLGIIFVISSLCAGAISSGILLGFISEYVDIMSSRSILVTTSAGVSNIGYVLKNLFSVGNLKLDYYNNFEPFIYCGLITSFFSILYFFNKDIDKKKRYAALGVIAVFIISFSINFLNLFWHLSSPIMLNFRYSIYLGMFLTTLAYECYISKNKLNGTDIVVLTIFLIIGFAMAIMYSNEVYVLWTALFLVLIYAFILLVKNKSKKFEVLLCLTIMAEIFMNGYLSLYTAGDIPSGKFGTYDDFNKINSEVPISEDYRTIHNFSYTEFSNDSLLLNKYSSLRYFSSVIDGDVTNFFYKNLTTGGSNNYKLSAYESPLLLSLMGNKYFYLTEEIHNSIYKKVSSSTIDIYNYDQSTNETKTIYLYENPYALSLGYVIENDVKHVKGMDLVDYQNAIIKAFTGKDEDVMVSLDYTSTTESEDCKGRENSSCKTYTITNDTNNVNVYIYALLDEVSAAANHKLYLDVARPFIVSTVDKEVNVTLVYSYILDDGNFLAATYNEDNLIDSLSYLQNDMIENVKIDKNVLTAQIDSSKSGTLFLSIPYDDNFRIYVDNKEVEYYSLLENAFIGLDIEEGFHDIVIEYTDDNFKWYLMLSILAIVVTLTLYFTINKSITKRKLEEQQQQELLDAKRAKNKEKKKQKNKRK